MITEQQEKWLSRTAELFLRYGIKSQTMDDIARELGISKKTLYQFVNNKDDLVMKVIEYHLTLEKNQDACFANEATDAVEEMLLVIENASKDMQLMKANIMYDLEKYHRKAWDSIQEHIRIHLLKEIKRNLERGIREGLYRHDIHPDIMARLHVSHTFLLFDENWFPLDVYPRETLFREYILQYLHGILNDEGRKRLKAKLS
ncbi:MAG: TetR/AcrR family transcriptional regulator [Saprospiraceae bacterium]